MVARQGLADDDEYENIFKGLEKEFDKALLECIVRIGKRCILLVGKDIDLAGKIACYLYYKGDSWGFCHVDCLNERELIEKNFVILSEAHYFSKILTQRSRLNKASGY